MLEDYQITNNLEQHENLKVHFVILSCNFYDIVQ